MENNEFDRSDFKELLDYLKILRGKVDETQTKTDSFCTSFSSGLDKVGQALSKIKLSGLNGDVVKLQGYTRELNKWVKKNASLVKEIGIANAENTISFMATTSEMTYKVLDTLFSLDKIQNLKITTHAEENMKALDGIVGSGERMKELFDELKANPLLENLGLKEDPFAKLRSGWEVLRDSREDVTRLMTTYGEGMRNIQEFREGWKYIEENKGRSFNGLGSAVKTIFKKNEKQPGEEKQKNGFFSIFKKKGEGDKNWFSAVGHRFNAYKDRTKEDLQHRFLPLIDYITRLSGTYGVLGDMTGNAVNVLKLGKDFQGQAQMTWLKAANGWGIGDRRQQQEILVNLEKKETVRREKNEVFQEKISDAEEKMWETLGKMNAMVGQNPQSTPTLKGFPLLEKEVSVPEIAWVQSSAAHVLAQERRPAEVHIGSLVENLTITSANLSEGVDKIKETIIEELQRILNQVNNWACETNLN